jgi:cephalosporin hydroxylase
MRLGDWLVYQGDEIILDRCRWMGVKALKNPLDAWIYQEIIHETRPEVIVELGSKHGGSTLFLAHMLDLLGGEGTVVSVDARRDTYDVEYERIVTVTGYTTSEEVVSQVRAVCEGRRTMLIHDASHRTAVVLEDLRNYSGLISPGCYLIVEDGVVDVTPLRRWKDAEPGPYPAVARFLREAPHFEVDSGRERYLATYNPRGFLRRRA